MNDELLRGGPWVYDERVGCVAVYKGPHVNCLSGVEGRAIYYRHGKWVDGCWTMMEPILEEGRMVCAALNLYARMIASAEPE